MSDETVKRQPDLLAVEQQADIPCYFRALSVENVRSFSVPQRLDLADSEGRPAQWTILLGDNGTGKTTLLQCLAAFSPNALPNSPQGKPRAYVPDIFNRFHDANGKYRSFKRVSADALKLKADFAWGARLEGIDQKPHHTSISLRMAETEGETSNYPKQLTQFIVYGYGANRRIGNVALSETRDSDPHATLFDDNCSLLNAEEWLLQADYAAAKTDDKKAAERRDRIKQILIRLLPDVEALRIHASGSTQSTAFVEAKTPFGWVTMRALSTGYRSVVAWMVDLASRMFDRYPNSQDPLAEPAIVLVDQIDLLLHPKWQRELVQTLTTIFRNTQFIVTAHSPLIVQAAMKAKIVLLRREGDHVVIDNRADSVRGWRLDQIVASDLFEELPTRDVETDDKLARRRVLLAKKQLDEDEERELQQLNEWADHLPTADTQEDIRAMELIRRAAEKMKQVKA